MVRKMVPRQGMKYPVLTLLLIWALLAFMFFTVRSTTFLCVPSPLSLIPTDFPHDVSQKAKGES